MCTKILKRPAALLVCAALLLGLLAGCNNTPSSGAPTSASAPSAPVSGSAPAASQVAETFTEEELVVDTAEVEKFIQNYVHLYSFGFISPFLADFEAARANFIKDEELQTDVFYLALWLQDAHGLDTLADETGADVTWDLVRKNAVETYADRHLGLAVGGTPIAAQSSHPEDAAYYLRARGFGGPTLWGMENLRLTESGPNGRFVWAFDELEYEPGGASGTGKAIGSGTFTAQLVRRGNEVFWRAVSLETNYQAQA